MDKQTEETLLKIADYSNREKEVFPKRIRYLCIAGLACILIYIVIDLLEFSQAQPYKAIADFALGLVAGGLLTGVLYSSRHVTKIRAAKMRLFKSITKENI